MSAAGEATFNSGINVGNNATFLGAQNTIRADDAFLRVEETDGTDIAYFGDVTGSGIGGSYLYNHGGTPTVQMRADQYSTISKGILIDAPTAHVEALKIQTPRNDALSTGLAYINITDSVAPFSALTIDHNGTGKSIEFRKGGSTVGSIKSRNSESLMIGSDYGSDAYICLSNDNVFPVTSTGAVKDGATNLGVSTGRFKDLYLSGGVYLGGTGSANKLEDYEEGTWTPSLLGASVSGTTTYGSPPTGWYRKIGDVVIAHCIIFNTNHTGSGLAEISGLPFVSNQESIGEAQMNAHSSAFPSSNGGLCNVSSIIQGGQSKIHMRGTYNDTTSGPYYVQMQNFTYLRITLTYKTT